jgi:Tfp pilus assembly protein PilO
MSPEAGKIASDQATAATDQTTLTGLRLQLAELIRESQEVRKELPYLRRFPKEIPPAPQYGQLVHELQNLEEVTDVSVNPIELSKVSLGVSGVTPIPLSLEVSGGHDQILLFLEGLTGTGPYKIQRLVTVQSFSLNGSSPNILAHSEVQYSASIAATAYTTGVAETSTAAGSNA